MNKQRYIPVAVRRQLRQEACFGCAKCGIPILQYHHIVPWAEEQHNRVDDMVALCGTCHQIVEKLAREVAYELKKKPFNAKSGLIRGMLGTDRPIPSFKMGTNTFINTPVIFEYFGIPIFQYEIRNKQSLISAFIPQSNFWPEIEIIENDLVASTGDFWDVEFKTNTLIIKRKQRENFLSIDLRGEHALVSAKLEIRGQKFEFDDRKTSIGTHTMRDCTTVNCRTGIRVGNDNEKVHRPNYAMRTPAAQIAINGRLSPF